MCFLTMSESGCHQPQFLSLKYVHKALAGRMCFRLLKKLLTLLQNTYLEFVEEDVEKGGKL